MKRTRSNYLPVYIDYKGGGNKVVTIVRKIFGNVSSADSYLKGKIPNIATTIKPLSCQIEIKGNFRESAKRAFQNLGF